MEIIDNVNKTLQDDLLVEIQKGSRVSIAAACFSIYAFAELKKELKSIEALRFIFTSPTFVQERTEKEKREFYIPRQERERNLYGSEFEIKLRNELTQKAIAKECADWIRKKAVFKSNITHTKYYGRTLQKQFDKYSLHSGNVYQIFTYVKNQDKDNTGNVAGILLYAKTDEDITPDCMFNMGGNQIGAKTLDLNKEFPLIAAQLDKLAEDYFQREKAVNE